MLMGDIFVIKGIFDMVVVEGVEVDIGVTRKMWEMRMKATFQQLHRGESVGVRRGTQLMRLGVRGVMMMVMVMMVMDMLVLKKVLVVLPATVRMSMMTVMVVMIMMVMVMVRATT